MILSYKHNFIFLKGKKVAGTSMEILLSEVCGPSDIITPITPIDERTRLVKGIKAAQNFGPDNQEIADYLSQVKNTPLEKFGSIKAPKGKYYNHMPLTEIIDFNKINLNNWTIFAVERCPYRKIISFANFRFNFKSYKRSGTTIKSDIKTIKKNIQKIIDNGMFKNVKNIDIYKNHEGKVCAQILRYEKLEEDIKKLMHNLNISSYPKLGHFKKGIHSNNLDLLKIFTNTQIATINELFKEEFDYYGYDIIE